MRVDERRLEILQSSELFLRRLGEGVALPLGEHVVEGLCVLCKLANEAAIVVTGSKKRTEDCLVGWRRGFRKAEGAISFHEELAGRDDIPKVAILGLKGMKLLEFKGCSSFAMEGEELLNVLKVLLRSLAE